jgi:hypothetical protein
MRMTFDDIVPSGGLHTIAKIRQATAGHDDVSLDEAAVRTFAAMDARLAELVAEIEATGAPTRFQRRLPSQVASTQASS